MCLSAESTLQTHIFILKKKIVLAAAGGTTNSEKLLLPHVLIMDLTHCYLVPLWIFLGLFLSSCVDAVKGNFQKFEWFICLWPQKN